MAAVSGACTQRAGKMTGADGLATRWEGLVVPVPRIEGLPE